MARPKIHHADRRPDRHEDLDQVGDTLADGPQPSSQ